MIERYSRPQMKNIWSDSNKFRIWLDIEILACEAQHKLGLIPAADLKQIKAKAAFEVPRILEIEKTTKHDVIAFLTNVAEHVGPSSRFIHMGLTSSDVGDTALSVQMVQAADILIADAKMLSEIFRRKAGQYRDTVMMGRSHGVHAEPTTFGLKMALYYTEMLRNIDRLQRARAVIRVGKISGAVGTRANIDPRVEKYVCEKLGLEAAPVSTQILQRDRHAEYLAELAVAAASLEKFCLEVRNLQRTEILEAEEYFDKGQKGSSAMPHKRNPITCERVCGLARVLRANAMAGLENVALWHERDITHSSVERVIIPDSTILLDYMFGLSHEIFERLIVYPENMIQNIQRTKGLIFSQRILLALVDKGVTREDAYKLVQRNAMRVWKEDTDFKTLLLGDGDVTAVLPKKEIEKCFDMGYHLRNVAQTFKGLGIK